MPQIMEAKVVSPCPLKCADPSVLEGVCVLPLSKKRPPILGTSLYKLARARSFNGIDFATRLTELRPGAGASHSPSPRETNHSS